MTLAPTIPVPTPADRRAGGVRRVRLGRGGGRLAAGGLLCGGIVLACVLTLPWTLPPGATLHFDGQDYARINEPPTPDVAGWFGTDQLGRSLLGRCLLGGCVSLLVGLGAATVAVVVGLAVGLVAGYRGGWVDGLLMRSVDVLYGLPYLLLVILLKLALQDPLERATGDVQVANFFVLFLAIGLVSWLTMARVVRGQVLSLRHQPFIEAARAAGLPGRRVFFGHLLPNLAGPIVVYATLTIPQAVLQESFLSFLGIGVIVPTPSWGLLASDALRNGALNPLEPYWWQLLFPCLLLATTLLGLNFLGDGLRDRLDPKHESGKL